MATILVGYDTETAAVGEALSLFTESPNFPLYAARARPRDLPRGAGAPDRGARRRRRARDALRLRPDAAARARAGSGRARRPGSSTSSSTRSATCPSRTSSTRPGPASSARSRPLRPWRCSRSSRRRRALIQRPRRRRGRRRAHAVRLPPRPARPARPARDRARAGPPLRHLVGPQRGERQPDAVGVQPFAYAEEGYPDILELPFQFWLDVVWFDQHGYDTGPAAARGAEGRGRRGGRARPRLRRVLPRLGRDRLGRAQASAGCAGSSRYAQEKGVEVTTYTDYWRRVTGA